MARALCGFYIGLFWRLTASPDNNRSVHTRWAKEGNAYPGNRRRGCVRNSDEGPCPAHRALTTLPVSLPDQSCATHTAMSERAAPIHLIALIARCIRVIAIRGVTTDVENRCWIYELAAQPAASLHEDPELAGDMTLPDKPIYF